MQVHFTTGNPALGADHLHRGSIHLTQGPQSLAERDYGQALPDANLRRATVALVGVPSRFVPTDVVELLAPFRNSVREIRIFRHADPPRLGGVLAPAAQRGQRPALLPATHHLPRKRRTCPDPKPLVNPLGLRLSNLNET